MLIFLFRWLQSLLTEINLHLPERVTFANAKMLHASATCVERRIRVNVGKRALYAVE